MSFQDLIQIGLCQDDHPHHEQTPTSTGPQHVSPLQQLFLEGTNHHLLLTSGCSHQPDVTPSSSSYLRPEQWVGQGHGCEGLVGLLDIDGDLVGGGWRRWRWFLLQGQTGGKGEHRGGVEKPTRGIHSPALGPQSLTSGKWKGIC